MDKQSIKEGLEAIKKLFFSYIPPVAPVVAPVQTFTDYPLEDGSVLSIDKLEVGGAVTQNGVPAADGSFTLSDGTTLTIVGGLIAELNAKQEEDPMAQMKKEMETSLAQLRAEYENKFNELLGFNETQKEANKLILASMEKFLAFEVAVPVQKPIDLEGLTPLQRRRATK